ncbi:hypothetical protein DPF_1872 [Desulfoplanes formicivorans]|uniref:Uncharacterized protein n=1 Tax=Desulfoplanes formicivorans TaxID=1592317 RepID=A0A194AGF2_9BACT|nr:hypothetical protein DPF_1872 [Desulfoplanes formicivorans]
MIQKDLITYLIWHQTKEQKPGQYLLKDDWQAHQALSGAGPDSGGVTSTTVMVY